MRKFIFFALIATLLFQISCSLQGIKRWSNGKPLVKIPSRSGGYHEVFIPSPLSNHVELELKQAQSSSGFSYNNHFVYQPVDALILVGNQSYVISENGVLVFDSSDGWKRVSSPGLLFLSESVVHFIESGSVDHEIIATKWSQWRPGP